MHAVLYTVGGRVAAVFQTSLTATITSWKRRKSAGEAPCSQPASQPASPAFGASSYL